MTELTIFKSANVPAHLRGAEISETTKALMGGNLGGKRISIKGGTFRLVVGGKEVARIDDRHLDVIVVKAAPKVGRQYYRAGYDPDAQAAAPDCWSNDGEKPDVSIKAPQHTTCNGCPQNIAGSGRGESRACRYQQRLAVLIADDLDAGVHQLALPATSLFGKEDGNNRPLQAYVRYLASQTPPVNIEALVTRMKFDTSVESPKLFFAPVRWISAEEYALAKEAANSPEAAAAVSMTVAQTDGVSKPAPMEIPGARPDTSGDLQEEGAKNPGGEPYPTDASIKPIKTRKAKPEEAVEVVDEPEKRKPAAKTDAAVPKKGPDLASVVSAWDDE